MNVEQRTKAILELARFTGVEVSADFVKNTAEHFPQAGIPRIHTLIEGIYAYSDDSGHPVRAKAASVGAERRWA